MGQVAVPRAPAPLCSVLVLPALAPDLSCLWPELVPWLCFGRRLHSSVLRLWGHVSEGAQIASAFCDSRAVC